MIPIIDPIIDLEATLDPRPLLRRWETYARAAQLFNPDGRPIVNKQAGRGEGKTRSGSEHSLTLCERWGPQLRGLVASKTDDDTTGVMVLGPAGLLACARARGYELDYSPSKATLTHPSGATLQLGSGQVRELGRGLSINYAWLDEISWWAWAVEAFANVRFALRLAAPAPGRHLLVTSTPSHLCRLRLDDPELVQTIRGRTRDNVDNLAPNVVAELERTYDGHPLGRQELEGELVSLDGALVSLARIHECRVERAPILDRIAVAVDPGGFAVRDPMAADLTGIVVVGLTVDPHPALYVLADMSVAGDESVWAPIVAQAAREYRAGLVVVETNQGGAMTLATIRRAGWSGPLEPVTATMAKLDRALPIAQQYTLGRVHHVGPAAQFRELETQLTTWSPKSGRKSPDRLDALVHACNALLPDDTAGVGPLISPDFRQHPALDFDVDDAHERPRWLGGEVRLMTDREWLAARAPVLARVDDCDDVDFDLTT